MKIIKYASVGNSTDIPDIKYSEEESAILSWLSPFIEQAGYRWTTKNNILHIERDERTL